MQYLKWTYDVRVSSKNFIVMIILAIYWPYYEINCRSQVFKESLLENTLSGIYFTALQSYTYYVWIRKISHFFLFPLLLTPKESIYDGRQIHKNDRVTIQYIPWAHFQYFCAGSEVSSRMTIIKLLFFLLSIAQIWLAQPGPMRAQRNHSAKAADWLKTNHTHSDRPRLSESNLSSAQENKQQLDCSHAR